MRCLRVIAPGTILVVVLTLFVVAAAQNSAKGKSANEPAAEVEPSYGEASLKFDIIEAQLQTLRKKMQLQSKRKAEQTREWNDHYERVKQHIEAWDDFVESYDVE